MANERLRELNLAMALLPSLTQEFVYPHGSRSPAIHTPIQPRSSCQATSGSIYFMTVSRVPLLFERSDGRQRLLYLTLPTLHLTAVL